MAMSSNKHDREQAKFAETTGGETAVRVVVQDSSGASEATLLNILSAVDELEGYTDGLEGFLSTLNTTSSSILSAVDGLEGFTDGLEGFVDGIEGQLTTLNSKDFATSAKQDTGNTSLATVASTVYTEGDTDATITGIPALWEDTGNTLKTVSSASPLPVNVVSGSSSGTEYTEGDIDTTISGRAILAEEVSTSTLKTVNTKQLGTQVTNADWGVITNSLIHGLSSAGGGSFVDVKVTPSGALNVAATQDTSPWVVSGTVAATQSGTWNINNISGTISLPTGAATSANQTTANASLSSIDSKLTSPLSVAQSGTWTVAATQSGTWNITNISGTVSLPTGAATESTIAKLTLTQGSTTSGQTGALIFGAVTSAAPTYTTAQSSPLSLTTAGALRTDGSGSTQPISGTVTANQGGSWTVAATQSGTWNITNISGTVSLPTGAATAANQATANASLSSIDSKLTSPIQVQTVAGSAGSMQLKTVVYAAKSVTTSATLMNKTGTNLANRIILTMQPTNGTIYIGSDASVTTSTGTPVETGAFFPMYANSTCNIYAIAAGTVDVRIMEGSDQ